MGAQRKVMAGCRRTRAGPELPLALSAVLAALGGCERQADAPATAAPAAWPAGRTVEARLRRFECEERCWLEVELADNSVISGVCNAAACVPWLDQGARLPTALVGARARILLRQDKVCLGTEDDCLEAEEFRAINLLE